MVIKRICLKVSILFKTDTAKMWLPIMPIWLSRTIPMSKYFSGSRPLRHNEVQLYYYNIICFACKQSPVATVHYTHGIAGPGVDEARQVQQGSWSH